MPNLRKIQQRLHASDATDELVALHPLSSSDIELERSFADDGTGRPKALADTELWLNVMHRRTCYDARHIHELSERLWVLENPWWKRFLRKLLP